MRYRLSRKADEDLFQIHLDGIRKFGPKQADRYYDGFEPAFDFLAAYPRASRERTELDTPIRAHRYGAHVIVYVIEDDGIVIVRVRHGREDWQANPI